MTEDFKAKLRETEAKLREKQGVFFDPEESMRIANKELEAGFRAKNAAARKQQNGGK